MGTGSVTEAATRGQPTLPLIDIAPLRSRGPGEKAVVEAIDRACRDVGFFYVTGHGVDRAIVDAAFVAARGFFHLSEAEKCEVLATRDHYRGYFPAGIFAPREAEGPPDPYQQFKIQMELAPGDPDVAAGKPLHGPNRWPVSPPGFRSAVTAYFNAMRDLGDDLLQGFALGLGLDRDRFMKHFTKPLSPVSLLYYPPRGAAEVAPFGVHPHKDDDAFTILVQDDAGGLQVERRDGGWMDAPPLPDAFVINIGNMLETWSAGRYVSTPHRVVQTNSAERLSMPFFAVPDFDTEICPVIGETPPSDAPLHVGRHMVAAYDGNWARRGDD